MGVSEKEEEDAKNQFSPPCQFVLSENAELITRFPLWIFGLRVQGTAGYFWGPFF